MPTICRGLRTTCVTYSCAALGVCLTQLHASTRTWLPSVDVSITTSKFYYSRLMNYCLVICRLHLHSFQFVAQLPQCYFCCRISRSCPQNRFYVFRLILFFFGFVFSYLLRIACSRFFPFFRLLFDITLLYQSFRLD